MNDHPPIACAECDTEVPFDSDAEGAKVPCSNCGSIKRRYTATMGPMQPTNYLLDNFIAHRLSELATCGMPDLPSDEGWLNAFILRSIFQFRIEGQARAYLFNFLRRTEGASASYRLARESLLAHLSTPRNVVSHYFKALTQLEICIAQCYQACEIVSTALGEKVYESGDGSPEERLQTVYVDSKHMDQMIKGEKLPAVATAGIWITNEGIESARGKLPFAELHALLLKMHAAAEKLSSADAAKGNEG